jgi:hypothetical protein
MRSEICVQKIFDIDIASDTAVGEEGDPLEIV